MNWLFTHLYRLFFYVSVYANSPFGGHDWPRWRKHRKTLFHRPLSPEECVESIEAPPERANVVADVIQTIATQFGLPVSVLRRSDRFGHELYLPSKLLQYDAEETILLHIYDLPVKQGQDYLDYHMEAVEYDFCLHLYEEHGIASDQDRPSTLDGLRVEDVIGAMVSYECRI